MPDTKNPATKYHIERLLPLIEGTVVSIIVDDQDPTDIYCGLVIKLLNGKEIEVLAARDPEFNGAGHLSALEI